MENLWLHKAAPTSVNVTVGRRNREYLTEREVERPHMAASASAGATGAASVALCRSRALPGVPCIKAAPFRNSVAREQEHSAYGALYRAIADALQGLLAEVNATPTQKVASAIFFLRGWREIEVAFRRLIDHFAQRFGFVVPTHLPVIFLC